MRQEPVLSVKEHSVRPEPERSEQEKSASADRKKQTASVTAQRESVKTVTVQAESAWQEPERSEQEKSVSAVLKKQQVSVQQETGMQVSVQQMKKFLPGFLLLRQQDLLQLPGFRSHYPGQQRFHHYYHHCLKKRSVQKRILQILQFQVFQLILTAELCRSQCPCRV